MVLENEKEITDAQNKFEGIISIAADRKIPVQITCPYGQTTAVVYWMPRFNIWAYCGLPIVKKARLLQ